MSIHWPPLDSLTLFLDSLTGIVDFFSSLHVKIILMGCFNAQSFDNAVADFMKLLWNWYKWSPLV